MPDNELVLAAVGDGPNCTEVISWNIRTGQRTTLIGITGDWPEVRAFSPDGRMMAVVVDGTLWLWDLAAGRQKLRQLSIPYSIGKTCFSQDGTLLAVATRREHSVWIFDTQTGEHRSTLLGHKNHVSAMHFSPDRRTLATGQQGEPFVRLWNVATGREMVLLEGIPNGSVLAVAFEPDGSALRGGGHFVNRWALNVCTWPIVPEDN
jgi:WD40 repeat protein